MSVVVVTPESHTTHCNESTTSTSTAVKERQNLIKTDD